MTYNSLADLVRANESGAGNPAGNYTAVNPTSGASGAYQFLDSTWRGYASAVPEAAAYPTAADAPASVQDAVFNHAVSVRGLGDWTCPGCNSAISSYVSNNDVSNLPVFSGGSSAMSIDAPSDFNDPGVPVSENTGDGNFGGDGGDTIDSGTRTQTASSSSTGGGGVFNPTGLEQAGAPGKVSSTFAIPDIGNAIAKGFGALGDNIAAGASGMISSLEAYFQNGFVMVLAIVLFLVAAWLMVPRETKQRIATTAAMAA